MKRLAVICSLLFCIACAIACVDTTNNKLIIGNWTGTQWLVNGMPGDKDAANTHFTFGKDGYYTYNYAGNVEKGTFIVENDMLFTTPTGEQEIMVKINRLTQDSLVFEMNRAGTKEILVLLRK